MVIVEAVLGNVADDLWKVRLSGAAVDWIALDQWEAQKNRFRKKTQEGVSVAVSLERGRFLRDGDILLFDDKALTAVVARISLRDVMVVRLEGLASKPPELLARICVELGHALGNQHWPAVVKEGRVFVPLTVDKKVMASVMKTHAFTEINYEFVPGAEVIPYLAPHEVRRLFGGAEGPVHTHIHSDEQGDAHAHRDHLESHRHGDSNGLEH